ncbi:MAG: leucine-rich repeat domain-containing protein [Ruminococcus sp.]|nr:leucine-rich repeat domain-containing protein [Ruminococcus sp.]
MAFIINNGILERYDPEPDELDIIIPDDVVKIGERVFRGRNIKSVTIPSSVKVIEREAFELCHNLTKVTLNNGLENIKKDAFHGCSINEIEIPETVKTIGEDAFASASITSINIPEKLKHITKECFVHYRMLENISVSENNKNYKSLNGVLFDKDMKTLICYPPTKKDSCYTVPDGVEVIQKWAFLGCNSLKSVTFPESMKWIESCSFQACENLKHITIPCCEMVMNSKAFYITHFSDVTIIGRKITINVSDYFRTANGAFSAETMRFFNCITYAPYFKDKFFAEIKESKFKVPLAVFLLIEYGYPTVKAYISRNIRHIVKYLIDSGDAENLTKMLDTGYITQKNIGDFINYAIKQKCPEIQIILSNFKNDNIGFKKEKAFYDLLL